MELINIDVVCPIYKGYDYLTPLLKSIKMQDGVKINNIIFGHANNMAFSYIK